MNRSIPSFMSKPFVIALSLAALSAAAVAQEPAPPPPPMQPPAPIVHYYAPNQVPNQGPPNQRQTPPATSLTSPAEGIWVRSAPGTEVKTVTSTADSVELSVTKGLANITLRHPKENEQIMVDLPGGQVALFKDGTYTFNAATSTFRVLQGEAAAYPAADANAKPLTVKEDHAVVFGAGGLKSVEFAPFQARADILPAGPTGYGREPGYDGPGYYSRGYGYWGPYGDGFYAAPYYAWGYPYGYGWGGPWGWGYPYGVGFGVGYGYYGGYGYGVFRGGLGFRR